MNQQILQQTEPEILLVAKMTKLKLSYFRHIMRRHILGNDNYAGENKRWQEKKTTKYEMDGLHKEVIGMRL